MTYIPASLPGAATMCNLKHNGKDVAWWTDKSFFKYPKMLVSAYYGMKIKDFKKRYNIGDDVFFCVDSSGFQQFSLKDVDYVSQREVLEWQEQHGNMGFILDYPPYKLIDGKIHHVTDDEFGTYAEKTFKNAQYVYEKKKRDDLKIYNILQGNTVKRFDMWYNKLSQVNLDGWAIAFRRPQNSNPFYIARAGMYLYNKGMKENIHFLAVSGTTVVPILYYLKRFIKNITFDSSSFIIANNPVAYFVPNSLRKTYLEFGQKFNGKLEKLPCNCPVCSKIKVKDLLGSTLSIGIVNLHNLHTLLNYYKVLESLKDDKEKFKEFVGLISPRCLKAIEFIDSCQKHGFEQSLLKFEKYFNEQQVVNKYKSLFGEWKL